MSLHDKLNDCIRNTTAVCGNAIVTSYCNYCSINQDVILRVTESEFSRTILCLSSQSGVYIPQLLTYQHLINFPVNFLLNWTSDWAVDLSRSILRSQTFQGLQSAVAVQCIGGSRGMSGAAPSLPPGPNSFVFTYILPKRARVRGRRPPWGPLINNGKLPPSQQKN